MTRKKCGRCSKKKFASDYHRHPTAPDGLQSYCKLCMSSYRSLKERRKEPRPQTTPGNKWCRRCKRVKPLGEFYLNPRMHDGHHSWCTPCVKESAAKSRAPVVPSPVRPALRFDVIRCVGCCLERHRSHFPKSPLNPENLSRRCNDCWPAPAQLPELRRPKCKAA